MKNSVDVSDIFYFFFCFGAGEREEASEEVAGGGRFLIKIEGGGGGSEEEAREGEGRRGNVYGEGGGAKFFFSGPKCPPRKALVNAALFSISGLGWGFGLQPTYTLVLLSHSLQYRQKSILKDI